MARHGRRLVWLVAALVLASAGVGLAEAGTASLSAVHWDDAYQRWKDIAGNAYVAGKVDVNHYEGDTVAVTVDYQAAAPTFTGTLTAAGLKPNFAYQLKLNGKPTLTWGTGGDDWANEQLGYAGRWWVNQYTTGGTWVDGWNSTDAEYEYWRARDFTDGAYYYVFEGYLLFDYIVTGSDGSATLEFSLDSSYHVLWKTTQRQPGANDSEPTSHDVVPGDSPDWYSSPPPDPTSGIEIYAEWQSGRPTPGNLVLPEGDYNIQIFLTEEDFHETMSWATVMRHEAVQFTVQHESAPVKYWAVICGIADYQTINDLAYTDDDAVDLTNALKQFADWQGSDQIELLLDSAASKNGIRDAIIRMGQKANAVPGDHDVCLFVFSGHGTQVSDSSGDDVDGIDEALCPWDMKVRGFRVSNVITDDELGTWLSTYLPADANVVAIFDTCFSGGLAQNAKGLRVKSVRNPALPAKAKARRGFGRGLAKRLAARGTGGEATGSGSEDIGGTNSVVLMACAEGGLSYETPTLQNGVFSYYVIEGIGSPSAVPGDGDGDGLLAAEEDYAYAAPKTTQTAANDPYLGVTQEPKIYDGNPYAEAVILSTTPPPPVNDVAIASVTAPASVIQGATVDVVVTVANEGNQTETFDVTLTDETDSTPIGTQTVTGLAGGGSVDLTFLWNTNGASLGDHVLTADAAQVPGETDTDDNTGSTTVTVNEQGSVPTMHVASIDMGLKKKGKNWSGVATVQIVDGNDQPVSGALVYADWLLDEAPLSSTSATTDASGVAELTSKPAKAEAGQTFKVVITNVTKAGAEYDATANVESEDSITVGQ